MTAPTPPSSRGPLRSSQVALELDESTQLAEGPLGEHKGLLRVGDRTAFIDVVFTDLAAVERMMEALQALHHRLSTRRTHLAPVTAAPVLRAVPRG
ncbi:MAG: hypothetical protein ACXV2J_13500 [Actinomycetes bacterium]